MCLKNKKSLLKPKIVINIYLPNLKFIAKVLLVYTFKTLFWSNAKNKRWSTKTPVEKKKCCKRETEASVGSPGQILRGRSGTDKADT